MKQGDYEGQVPDHCDGCQRTADECGMDEYGWITILPPKTPAGLYCFECFNRFGHELGMSETPDA